MSEKGGADNVARRQQPSHHAESSSNHGKEGTYHKVTEEDGLFDVDNKSTNLTNKILCIAEKF